MFPVNEVNEVKPDGPGLRRELPSAIRLLLDHLYSLANIETEQACNLAKPCEACSLIIAGFVALDLLGLHTQTRCEILLRPSRRDPRLNEHLRQSFEGIQFKNLGAAGLQCLVFLKFRFEVLQLALQPGLLCLPQLQMNVLRPGRRSQLLQRSSELFGVSLGDAMLRRARS